MRTAFLALLLVALASAQFGQADSALYSCRESCCSSNGGTWGNGSCAMPADSNAYSHCEDSCLRNATGAISGTAPKPDFCCAPAFMLAAVAGLSLRR